MPTRIAPLLAGAILIAASVIAGAAGMPGPSQTAASRAGDDTLPPRPWVIAHRGASAYAPENTVPAFVKAIEQGATFVEIDVQRTKDGVIVCLHDPTLDRTTDVAQRFPDRARQAASDKAPRFWLEDFTYAEVRQLDAGRWFHADFAGTRIPTFAETIAAVRGRTGIYIELKLPDRYPGIEKAVLDELRTHGLATPGADRSTPILVQSFQADSLEQFARLGTGLPIHLLFSAKDADTWLSAEGLARARSFSTGLSPEKSIFATHGTQLREARRSGLPLTPWTFRSTQVAAGHATVTAEMTDFVAKHEVDGLITDNPDLAPPRK